MIAYVNLFKQRYIANLQYRVAAIAGILTQFFFGFVFIFVYYAFYTSNGNSALPMNLSELITYIWLQQAFYSLIYPYNKDKELLKMIKNGDISYELIRPQDFFFKFYIKMVANKFANVSLRAIPILLVAFFLPAPFNLCLPMSVLSFTLFLISLLLSCFLVSSLIVILHLLVVFTVESRGTFSLYGAIVDILSGAIVPIPFLPKFLIKINEYLPFKYISDFPFRVYSGNISVNQGISMIFGSIMWIIITILIGEVLSKIILKKAVVQGG